MTEGDATQSPSAPTRDALIQAARLLFGQRGFDGTSVRAITSAADANLGAVTYHFGSKRGLYAAVLESGLRPLSGRVHQAARGPGSARDRMLAVVEAYFDHLKTHPDLPHLLLQEVAAGKEPPDVVLEIVRGVKTTIAGLHIEGVEEGSVRPGHPVLTALSVIAQPIYLTLVSPILARMGGIDLTQPEHRDMALEHILAFVNAGLEPAAEVSS